MAEFSLIFLRMAGWGRLSAMEAWVFDYVRAYENCEVFV